MIFRFGNVVFFPPGMNFDFMKWRWVSITISTILVLVSILAIAFKGINYSIDYLGGAEVSVSFTDAKLGRAQIMEAAEKANLGTVEVTTSGAVGGTQDSYFVKISREKGGAEDATSQKASDFVVKLKEVAGADKVTVGSITNISGKIGDEEQMRGFLALFLSFIGILIYVSYRFDSRFAPGAVACLLHDVIVALGVMTLLGKPFSVSSIAAFLTIVGYSCNDTIIIYDRIREIQLHNSRLSLTEIVNKSINQTMNRTVLTAVTGMAALLVLVFFGGGALEDFALTMFIGIGVGSFSSIYVAAPLTLVMDDFFKKHNLFQNRVKVKAVKDPNYIPPVMLKKKKTD